MNGKMLVENINFPPNWQGDLPPCETRDQLKARMQAGFARMKLTESQINEALDFLEVYEKRYYEQMVEGGGIFHRTCGGGFVVEKQTGVFCAKCGKLLDLFPPEFMRNPVVHA